MLLRCVVGAAAVAFGAAMPLEGRALMNNKLEHAPQWKASDGALPGHIQLTVALKQNNADTLHAELLKVSDPTSDSYGKHWSREDVDKFFAPSQESIGKVKNWVTQTGIPASAIRVSKDKGYMLVNATLAHAESLLHAKYKVFENENSGRKTVACDEYSVPDDIESLIDYVSPTTDLASRSASNAHKDLARAARRDHVTKRRRLAERMALAMRRPGRRSDASKTWTSSAPAPTSSSGGSSGDDLSQCAHNITLPCIRALFDLDKFPIESNGDNGKELAIVSGYDEQYSTSDLDLFWQLFDKRLASKGPRYVGLLDTHAHQFTLHNDEPNLDLEYTMPFVYPLNVSYIQLGYREDGTYNDLLDALDGSYCKYDGGDDYDFDPKAKDRTCGNIDPPRVISTSAGMDENSYDKHYITRQCHEYGKLGLQGVTFVFSSGDNGVGGNYGDGYCLDKSSNKTVPGGSRYVNHFPASCPYVTAVGGTQFDNKFSKTAQVAASNYKSGGGFSWTFDAPDYQQSAVKNYLAGHGAPSDKSLFNSGGRGYPDVSAISVNYTITDYGATSFSGGTSASAPVIATLLTIVNQGRLKKGKSAIGFANPVLYSDKLADAFFDVTSGDNANCNSAGFKATKGWDPVTGLGTPNFEKLYDIWVNQID